MPSIEKVRIPIIAVIVTIAIAGLIHFYRQFLLDPSHGGRALTGFLVLSLMSIALVVPYLWSDWLLRRQIKYFEVALVVVLGPGAVLRFSQGKTFQAALNGTIALVGLVAILPRLLGRGKMRAQQADQMTVEAAGDRQSPPATRGTGGRYFGLLLIWLVIMEILLSHARGSVPSWLKVVFILPAIWLAWESIFLFSQGGRDLWSKKSSIRKGNHPGGRA